MRILVDDTAVRLTEPEIFTEFAVRLRTGRAEADRTLAAWGAGRLTRDDHAAIRVEFLRRAAGELAQNPDWSAGLDSMLAYAERNRWLTPDKEILGHLEHDHTPASPQRRSQERYRVAVVGLGSQGTGIADLAIRLGHVLTGAVDIGDRVGTRIADAVPAYSGAARISASIDPILEDPATRPDIVVLAAAVELDRTLELAGHILDRGVDVITLNQDVFSWDPAWADAIDERAKAGGATLMGAGVQDIWWVQLITSVAAGVDGITRITLRDDVPLEALSLGIGQEIGVPLTAAEFEEHAKATADWPSVIGAPLVETARRLGAKAGTATKRLEPIFRDTEYQWEAGGITLGTDRTQGIRETVTFDTDLGFAVEGVISVIPAAEEDAVNEIIIEGDPVTRVGFGPITKQSTNIALVARIPDVVQAPPGVIFSADLPPARHQFRQGS